MSKLEEYKTKEQKGKMSRRVYYQKNGGRGKGKRGKIRVSPTSGPLQVMFILEHLFEMRRIAL
jgi:hypothetical protein